MKFFLNATTLLALGLSLNACSSGGGSGTTTVSNSMTTTYSSVLGKANTIGETMEAPASSGLGIGILAAATTPNFNDAWDVTATLPNSVTNSGSITVQQWMGNQLDPDLMNNDNAAINVFGRLKNALGIYCAVGVAAGMAGVTITNGYPANGTFNVTFTASMVSQITSQCDMDVADMEGESLAVTVADATGDYDKRFTFDDFGQVYFIRSDDNEINIATGEVSDGIGSASRTLVAWDLGTDVMRVEHVAVPGDASQPAGVYGYRLYYDGTADEGQLMVYEGSEGNANESTRYVLAAKPETGDGFSLSMSAQNLASNALFEACVSPDGDILDDGDRCVAGSTRLAGADVTSGPIDTVLDDLFAQKDDGDYAVVITTTAINWTTMSNMLTTNFAP